jgi:hypothetical protein
VLGVERRRLRVFCLLRSRAGDVICGRWRWRTAAPMVMAGPAAAVLGTQQVRKDASITLIGRYPRMRNRGGSKRAVGAVGRTRLYPPWASARVVADAIGRCRRRRLCADAPGVFSPAHPSKPYIIRTALMRSANAPWGATPQRHYFGAHVPKRTRKGSFSTRATLPTFSNRARFWCPQRSRYRASISGLKTARRVGRCRLVGAAAGARTTAPPLFSKFYYTTPAQRVHIRNLRTKLRY